jgi:putative transposase
MSKGKHTDAQMIGALKQLEAGRKAEDVARELGVSKHTIYAWEGEVRWHGCERGTRGQAVAR